MSLPRWVAFDFDCCRPPVSPAQVLDFYTIFARRPATPATSDEAVRAVTAHTNPGCNPGQCPDPKRVQNVGYYVHAVLEGKRAKVDCVGNAKALALMCVVLGVPFTVHASETHMYVMTDRILDFKGNLKYAEECQRSCHKKPSFYSATKELSSDDVIATTLLNALDDYRAFYEQVLTHAYGTDAEVDSAPVWIRTAFALGGGRPELLIDDAEALAHPFVAVDVALGLKEPTMLARALLGMDCSGYLYDTDLFYTSSSADSTPTWLSTFEKLYRIGAMANETARGLLENARSVADRCCSNSVAQSIRRRIAQVEEKCELLPEKRNGRRRGSARLGA